MTGGGSDPGAAPPHPELRATMSLADMNGFMRKANAAAAENAAVEAEEAVPNAAVANGNGEAAATVPPSKRAQRQLATPEEFVRQYDGKRTINKILIANNGIAGKCLNTSNNQHPT